MKLDEAPDCRLGGMLAEMASHPTLVSQVSLNLPACYGYGLWASTCWESEDANHLNSD